MVNRELYSAFAQCWDFGGTANVQPVGTMISRAFPLRNKKTARTQALKQSIVACFTCDPKDAGKLLNSFHPSDWESALWWLDISGMALYFLDRAQQLHVQALIPPQVEAALMRRLQRNQIRLRALHQEAAVLAGWFRGGGIHYALLKGASLSPDSVPTPSLRCQADLDFLVTRQNASLAIHYVHRLGYRLHAISGMSLEFRAGPTSLPDLNNIYSARTQRALELHLMGGDGDISVLSRTVARLIDGEEFDTLSPPDILVQQALHLLKHLCGEHTRLSWFLEFRRHMQTRRDDVQFWNSAQLIASSERNGNLAMAVTAWAAGRMFGTLDLSRFPQWQEGSLSRGVRLWLERYAVDLLMSDSVGSKLYALLRSEISSDLPEQRSTKKILFPHYLPTRQTVAEPNESMKQRWRRILIECDFLLRRLYFHVSEGFRLGLELARWKKALVRSGE
jgi:hypothetical protein